MKADIVIPARLTSSRLLRKVLADIAGKPMIQHVYERACQAHTIQRVIIAADSKEVVRVVESWGGEVVLTDPSLPSGTARIASIIDQIDSDIIVNVQGDQPLVEPDLIDDLVQSFCRLAVDIATPVWRINNADDLVDSGIVKVVRGHDDRALYFSRSPIPHVRDLSLGRWLDVASFWGHVGIYGYRRGVLVNYEALPESSLEQAERLEQLRFLQASYQIHTVETASRPIAVDTLQDLERVREIMGGGQV